jgi:hypothetical protein
MRFRFDPLIFKQTIEITRRIKLADMPGFFMDIFHGNPPL